MLAFVAAQGVTSEHALHAQRVSHEGCHLTYIQVWHVRLLLDCESVHDSRNSGHAVGK